MNAPVTDAAPHPTPLPHRGRVGSSGPVLPGLAIDRCPECDSDVSHSRFRPRVAQCIAGCGWSRHQKFWLMEVAECGVAAESEEEAELLDDLFLPQRDGAYLEAGEAAELVRAFRRGEL